MSPDPRAALAVLTAALERHLEACASKHGDDDPAIIVAADALADAFDAYDEALLDTYGEVTPLEIYDGEGIDEFEDEDELDDDDEDDEDDEDDDEDDDSDESEDFDEDDLDPDPDDDFDDHLEDDDTLSR
ncbi:DNA primase [Nostocoides sp. F2B08]|uniref:DNA primase n=1 Tax=Nostocoides sp. F2B08 TaxID=2653936 RepID=UPI001262F17F|nr:DNA primase [Tetrasphaera sp. F2B08]KAB7742954.1 DNA primase [Tetrasphaera sp. F2B08]